MFGAIWPDSGCLRQILSQYTLNGSCRDAVALGDLPQALSLAAVSLDGGMVQLQWIAADVPAFEAGAPHAGADPLDDQIAFQFGHRADDHHDSPAQRAAGVDLLAEADVLDVEPAQLVQHVKEVLHRSGDPV